MKKVHFLLGAGVGFVLGSRVGRGPYEHLEAKVKEIFNRPEIQEGFGRVREAAKDQVGGVTEKVTSKLPGSENGDGQPASSARKPAST